jgi:hypothetical protein
VPVVGLFYPMGDDMDEAEWNTRTARLRALNTEADDLAVAICELDGGRALRLGTPERLAHFRYVWSLPRFDQAARRRALTDPI